MLRMVKRTSLVRRGNEADTLVKIAEKEIRFEPAVCCCQSAKPLRSNDDLFLGLLRQMWRNSNTSKSTVSENILKRSRAALVTSTMCDFTHNRWH